MPGKKKGVLTVSGEWAKHLRPDGRRAFWSTERKAAQNRIASEMDAELPLRSKKKIQEQTESDVPPAPSPQAVGHRRSKP